MPSAYGDRMTKTNEKVDTLIDELSEFITESDVALEEISDLVNKLMKQHRDSELVEIADLVKGLKDRVTALLVNIKS
jgi:signal recognition particle GTPase